MSCANCGDDPCLGYIGCPTVRPKPFARAVDVLLQGQPLLLPFGQDEAFDVELAASAPGDQVIEIGTSKGEAEAIANMLNRVVAEREAKLLGAVVELIRRHETDGPIFSAVENLCADVMKLHPDGECVSGDVASGLAWDLGAARGMIEGSWGVLLDAMLEVGTKEAAQVAVALATKLGLDLPIDRVAKMMGALSEHTQHGELRDVLLLAGDGDLVRECERRGLIDFDLLDHLANRRAQDNISAAAYAVAALAQPQPPENFGAGPAEAILPFQLTTPLTALMERLRSLGIRFDAYRLDRDRAYYEAAQQACNAAVPPLEVRR